MGRELNTRIPPLLVRLCAALGSGYKLCERLGVPDNYPTKWRKAGYIPEQWALDIEQLRVKDSYGDITAYTVLYEAARVRRERIAEALRERD